MSDTPAAIADRCPTCAQLRAELAAERAARTLALIELLLLERMAAWPTKQ